ncbi:hypothetical protein [Taibaiella koreensis]|uniref:hypothetical protein n=1 Tax=Taibaiella koreensis TaxID=1268548 RepID=UPI000E59D556|nr:hypothetical protein [Taibaiella koreensis]
MATIASRKILLIGIDPSLIDFGNSTSGRTPESINAARDKIQEELDALGFEVHHCIVDLGATAVAQVKEVLENDKFDSIMIGGAVRALPQHTILFEEIINLIHQKAPASRICFNTGPETTVAAILRSIG